MTRLIFAMQKDNNCSFEAPGRPSRYIWPSWIATWTGLTIWKIYHPVCFQIMQSLMHRRKTKVSTAWRQAQSGVDLVLITSQKAFYGRMDGNGFFKCAVTTLSPNLKNQWPLHPSVSQFPWTPCNKLKYLPIAAKANYHRQRSCPIPRLSGQLHLWVM